MTGREYVPPIAGNTSGENNDINTSGGTIPGGSHYINWTESNGYIGHGWFWNDTYNYLSTGWSNIRQQVISAAVAQGFYQDELSAGAIFTNDEDGFKAYMNSPLLDTVGGGTLNNILGSWDPVDKSNFVIANGSQLGLVDMPDSCLTSE